MKPYVPDLSPAGLDAARARITGNNTTVTATPGAPGAVVTLYATQILTLRPGRLTLCHGGKRTHTTAARMNEALRAFAVPIEVYRKAGRMFARETETGREHEFRAECLTLRYAGEGFDADAQTAARLAAAHTSVN